MRSLQIVIHLLLLAFVGRAQTITETPTMVGVSIPAIPSHSFAGNDVEADSIVLFWTCDPFSTTVPYSQEIQFGDTIFFPKSHYLRGSIRAFWTDHNFTCPIGNVQRDGDKMPNIRLLETPGFGSQMNLPIISNAKVTRITIISPFFGMVYYKNFYGIEGQESLFYVTKFLPPGGKYTMFIKGFYSDEYLCKPSTSFSVGFIVVE